MKKVGDYIIIPIMARKITGKKKSFVITALMLGVFLAVSAPVFPKHTIALQPFGKIEPGLIQKIIKGVNGLYCNVDVEVRKSIDLPVFAYYKPRNRYKAKKLLYFLQTHFNYKVKKRYSFIIGLTAKDISIAKGQYEDWGIFGLAFLDTGPCVVSTFRLERKAKSGKHFVERVVKVVNHELGHAFGLPHCETKKCLMQDAKGTIKTVDESDGKLCPKCRAKAYRVLCK